MNDNYQSWRLKLNPSKTEVCAFHLNNKLANKELNIMFNCLKITHNRNPKYLGIWLDRSLTYKLHIKKKPVRNRFMKRIST